MSTQHENSVSVSSVDRTVTSPIDLAAVGNLRENLAGTAHEETFSSILGGERERFRIARTHLSSLDPPYLDSIQARTRLSLLDLQASFMLGQAVSESISLGRQAQRIAQNAGDVASEVASATAHAWALALAGQVGEAVRLLQSAGHDDADEMPPLSSWIWSTSIRTLIAYGDQGAAERTLARARRTASVDDSEPWLEIAAAHTIARQSSLRRAGELASHTARAAETAGMHFLAWNGFHLAATLGDRAAAGRLLEVIPDETATDDAMRTYASGLARLNPKDLSLAASRFMGTGHIWWASEAAAQHMVLLLGRGEKLAAAAAAERLGRIRALAPGLSTPILEVLDQPILTPRESQVALYAASGLTDQKISDTMRITIRTVQTHLVRVYAKLEISGRGDLVRMYSSHGLCIVVE